jgi:hypothetical protein
MRRPGTSCHTQDDTQSDPFSNGICRSEVSWGNTQGTTNKTVVIARVEPALSPYHFYVGVGTSVGVLLCFPFALQISGLIWRHGGAPLK